MQSVPTRRTGLSSTSSPLTPARTAVRVHRSDSRSSVTLPPGRPMCLTHGSQTLQLGRREAGRLLERRSSATGEQRQIVKH